MKTGKNSQYPFSKQKMSTTTATTTTPSGTSGEAALSAAPKTESRYMMFKNKRVKEIMHDSKQPETSYPGILNKRDAGRIAKFEWDRDSGKAPFSQLRTKRFKVAINELLPEFCYPEITTVPPPAVGREEYRKFAYNYTMGMLVNFFNTFSSIFTSFEGTGFENNFFRLKRDFCVLSREGIESVIIHMSSHGYKLLRMNEEHKMNVEVWKEEYLQITVFVALTEIFSTLSNN